MRAAAGDDKARAAVAEDTATMPALPRPGWDEARARHRGAGPALWIGAPEDRLKTDSDRLRYAGCTEAGADVRLDGRPLTVYPTGAFVGMLPLHAAYLVPLACYVGVALYAWQAHVCRKAI